MTTRAKFINTAAAELGVKESPRGSNRTKYTRAFGLTGPWCAMFIWWVAGQAGAGNMKQLVTGSFASCQATLNALRKQGRVRANKRDARPGDVVFFQFDRDAAVDHIGIVVEASAAGLVTIEGNTSSTTAGSQSNGGMVARRWRTWSTVAAVSTLPGLDGPAPSKPRLPATTPPATVNALKQLAKDIAAARKTMVGDGQTNTTNAVKFVQTALKVSADGKWGPQTKAALKKYQRAHGLVADGVVGPATWSSLYPR